MSIKPMLSGTVIMLLLVIAVLAQVYYPPVYPHFLHYQQAIAQNGEFISNSKCLW